VGNLEQAARLFARITAGHWFADYEVNAFGFTYSLAQPSAARLYTQLGEPERALEYWQVFLRAFTDPDPEHVRMVEEARAEVERLGRGR
jgi:hypothetical protein